MSKYKQHWLKKIQMLEMTDHIESCAQLETRPCPANQSLHGELKDQHWWSGWPGAHCMKCGDEDKNEVCLADNCKCQCHDDFWAKANEGIV